MSDFLKFPKQALPYTLKSKKWRKECVSWAQYKTFYTYSPVRNSVIHKKINYDLLNGKLHMEDIEVILNPNDIKTTDHLSPDRIQHYPLINSKLNVLKGEESKRVFDYRVVVTNPNSISEIEENKKAAVLQQLQQIIQAESQSEDEMNQKLDKMSDYFSFEWKDMREQRANALLSHYVKEYNIPYIFNNGFLDAMSVGEEIYQCDIVSGEPVLYKLNPMKVRAFKSGYSNRIEDSDIIILEDYWSPGRIIDTFYDVLSPNDIKVIENMPDNTTEGNSDSMDNYDDRKGFIPSMFGDNQDAVSEFLFDTNGIDSAGYGSSLMPYDLAGNVRVLKIFWKSKRKIKKVKSYDENGDEQFNFYPEDYTPDTAKGEEVTDLYVNEAWEGTLIGKDIYVNMRPRPIQYNRLSNPSLCHFGIIGTIYNIADSKPYSLVDMMKPYNYMYDVIHDRLNKAIDANWGTLLTVDLAKVPKGWEIEKWLYYAKKNHLAVIDSFKEGNVGAATGKLAGALNNASSGVIPANVGDYIQQNISLLEYIKGEMGEVVGITKQREGQISSRETVGGVERSNLQSTHITEWVFIHHEDTKRRVLECFLETAKIALRGRSMKFPYLLSDGAMQIMNVDGDEFAENDYGLVVDNSNGTQELSQKIDMLAQAALQNQTLGFATIMKLYNSSSLAEKERMVQKDEENRQQMQQQEMQQQQQQQQQQLEAEVQRQQELLEQEDKLNQRDNDTKIIIAQIGAQSKSDATNAALMAKEVDDGIQEPENFSEKDRAELQEKIRQFNEKLKLDREKHELEKKKLSTTNALKEKQIAVSAQRKTSNTSKK